jgi:hypothetical protein
MYYKFKKKNVSITEGESEYHDLEMIEADSAPKALEKLCTRENISKENAELHFVPEPWVNPLTKYVEGKKDHEKAAKEHAKTIAGDQSKKGNGGAKKGSKAEEPKTGDVDNGGSDTANVNEHTPVGESTDTDNTGNEE